MTRLVEPAKQDTCFAKTRDHRKGQSSATEGQENSRQAALSRVPGHLKDLYISGSCCYHERGRVWMAKGELKKLLNMPAAPWANGSTN